MKLFKSDRATALRLQAEATATPAPTPPRRTPPRRPVPLSPSTGARYGDGSGVLPVAPEAPTFVAPTPLATLAMPSVGVALVAEVVRAIATILSARSDAFEGRGEVREALARLADAPVVEGDTRVYVSPQAERVLSTFSDLATVDATTATLARLLAALLHADCHGPESTAPLDVDVADGAMRVALWYQRTTAPTP